MRTGIRWAGDPRGMTSAELEAAGYVKAPLAKVIRAKCLDCCCDNAAEVRRCVAVDCALWPYRMGSNPLSGNRGNPEVLRLVRAL